MRHCPSCGTENPNDAVVCTSCGTALSSADSTINFPLNPGETSGPVSIPAAQGLAELVVAKGPSTGERFALYKEDIWIGRDPDNDIFLNDVTVSRRHAKVSKETGRFKVSDVGSLNGTYLNGERVDDAELRHGDELWIGKYKLILVVGS